MSGILRRRYSEVGATLHFDCPHIAVIYEVIPKIFRTDAAIYTEVVVARSTGRW
jgi:hypothetical protein